VTTGIRIEELNPTHIESLRRFAEKVWDRPRTDAYYRWRYLDCPGLRGVLALRGDECVAAIFALTRRYRMATYSIDCLEPFDWYCMPELRGVAVGVQVMRRLMSLGPPIIALGGSDHTRSLLPRLGFTTVVVGRQHVLPLAGAMFRARRGAVAAALFDVLGRRWYAPRRRVGPDGLTCIPVCALDDSVLDLYREPTGLNLVALSEPSRLRWLSGGFAGAGAYPTFTFVARGQRHGWAFCRIFQSGGYRAGEILDLYLADGSEPHYTWAIAELSATLAGYGVHMIRASATAPPVIAALARNRFRVENDLPVMVWWRNGEVPSLPMHIMGGHGDGAFFPIVTHDEFQRTFGG
jgi:hypothetical protein